MAFGRAKFGLAIVLIATAAGCDHRVYDGSVGDARDAQGASPWKTDGETGRTSRVAVPEADHEAALHDAMARARETAEEARTRWAATGEPLRTRWAIKWAAPLASDEGGVEYLWVQPIHWSPFRIEGLLASEPVLELAAGRVAPGNLVSFPIDELADWVHYVDGDTAPSARREGGFTIDALEMLYGRP